MCLDKECYHDLSHPPKLTGSFMLCLFSIADPEDCAKYPLGFKNLEIRKARLV